MVRQKISARGYVDKLYTPGDATKHITFDGIQSGDRVVLYCRVSTRQQNHTGNLDAQERYLRAEMAVRGATVVEAVHHVGAGVYALLVGRAAAIAKPQKAKIVAVTTDRLVRNENFVSTGLNCQRNARATIGELHILTEAANGVELVTLVPPNASLAKCLGVQKKVGQMLKRRKGGRPKKTKPGYKKQRRDSTKPEAVRLRLEGKSIREIARILDVPASTVHRWV